MKKVIIVESPAKVKTISKYLDDDYTVVSSVGHIRDIPKREKGSLDMENGFKPNYEIIKSKQKVINEIRKSIKKDSLVLLATDPDREGEAIAWHLAETLNLKNYKRISFNEITKEAVIQAIKHPRQIDLKMKEAQEARRVLDRLFGYTLSKLIWKKVMYGLSAGRVQSPVLSMLAQREKEIVAFIPEKYYQLSGLFKDRDGEEFLFHSKENFSSSKEIEALTKEGENLKWEVKAIKTRKISKKPKPPLTTSTLQQQASNLFGWSTSNTMRVAQKLYETGRITYMRTDSTNLSEMAYKGIEDYVKEFIDKDGFRKTIYKSKKANIQEAHEAIRPADFKKMIAGKNEEEKKLYNLIYSKTVASQMKEASIESKSILIASSLTGKETPTFVMKGVKVIRDGWFAVDKLSRSKEVELKEFNKGDVLTCLEISLIEKETKPKDRYSEAGVVKLMEESGIGRPSTYAATIRTLIEKNYVEKINNSLKVTELGKVISNFLDKYFVKYINNEFTANMEKDLDKISQGKLDYVKLLTDFYYPFLESVNSKNDIDKLTTIKKLEGNIKCPKCNSGMELKLSRTGTFMSCEMFPECLGSRTSEGEVIKEPEELDRVCPNCNKNKLVKKMGRFGVFIACSSYPKCKHTEEEEEEKKKKDTKVKCTECSEGTLLERKGRFGIFYSCSTYPDCKLAIKARPTGDKCFDCGGLMMEGTKTIPTRCSNKTCPMHNPRKLE